ESGVDRRIVPMTFDREGDVVDGGKPILDGEEVIGHVKAADYGYSVDAGIAYGYLPPERAEAGVSLEVEFEGDRYPVTVAEEPLFDPDRERLLR
ncbi:MAG: glycine cleavage T C-terminal barrel domain-containing protein, partial [Halalkalicoccus sp.]